ncbi:MAG: hypothetical protein KBC22_02635 [Candidatus Pacebacteria bacterium]|nr:hypothetical protein [Candidatus Paceibacterota bacterium]
MFKDFEYIDLFGYIGAILIIVGFAMLSAEMVGPKDMTYLLLNLCGGIGIVITAFYRKDYPSGVLNVVFSLIALISLAVVYIF